MYKEFFPGKCINRKLVMGECIQEQVLALWPKNLVGSVLLLNTYATAGNWDLCESVELQRI